MKNIKYKTCTERSRGIQNIKGFTLVELLVVITIIAILSVVAYTAIGGQTVQARDAKRKQDLSTMQSALELYFVEFARYPAVLENGEATLAAGWKIPRKYLSEIPIDPTTESGYYYWTNDTEYIIGATLENEGAPIPHVVGNSDQGIVGAGDDGAGNPCDIEVGTSVCYPYLLN